jgi:hypothetical protein
LCGILERTGKEEDADDPSGHHSLPYSIRNAGGSWRRRLLVTSDNEGKEVGHLLDRDLPLEIGGHGREVGGIHTLDVSSGNHDLLSFLLS